MRILTVNFVLSIFTFAVKLLKHIEVRDARKSVAIKHQIRDLEFQRTLLDESATKAARVAAKINELVA